MAPAFRKRPAAGTKQRKNDVQAVFLALKAPGMPWHMGIPAAFTAAYALSRIDLVPDFIPMPRYPDDLLLLPLSATCTVRQIPPQIFTACSPRADGLVCGMKADPNAGTAPFLPLRHGPWGCCF